MATFILTAGHTHSLPTVLIGDGIISAGHEVRLVLVVSPWQFGRLYSLLRQRGLGWLTRRLGFRRYTSGINTSRLESFSRKMGIHSGRISAWAARKHVPVKMVKNLNSPAAIKLIEHTAPDAVVYSGGGILKGPFIRAAGVTLNAHAGPLPEIRGMNAAEWTYLLGARREITIHHIDGGIDTGPKVSSRVLEAQPADVDDLRDLAVLAGVQEMIAVIVEERWRNAVPVIDAAPCRQCFVMAGAIRELLNRRLRSYS